MATAPTHARTRPIARALSALAAFAVIATGLTVLDVQPPAAHAAQSADPTYADGGALAPVVSYDFDGDSGTTAADVSGNGNNGTIVVPAGTSPAYVAGVNGKALAVSSGTSYVRLPLVAGQTDASGSFSFELWVDEQSRSNYGTLLSNQNFAHCTNAGMTVFNQSAAGTYQACWGPSGASNYLTASSGTSLNTWHYLAGVATPSSNTMTFYLDGVAAGSKTLSMSLKSGLAFNIGGFSGSEADSADGYTNAYIDDVNLYNGAITAAQVAADYAATANPTFAAGDAVKPIVAYNFDSDSGTSVTDASGNANNGKWTNGTAAGGAAVAPTYVPGIFGHAARVGGNKNIVQLPLIPGKTDGSTTFSFEFWYYAVSSSNDQAVIADADTASCNNPGFSLYFTDKTKLQLSACWGLTSGGTKEYVKPATSALAGGWHYLTAVVDRSANTVKVYTDGQQTGASTAGQLTASSTLSAYPFTLGSEGSMGDTADGTVDGYVDDFNFYNAVIAPAQIAADYAATQHYQPVTVQNDGHGTGTATPAQAAAGATVKLAATPSLGYHFAGWVPVSPNDLAVAADGTFTDPGAAITVRATFAPNRYTVAFDGNGADGGAAAAASALYDQPLALPANGFTKTGSRFIGWGTSPNGAVAYAEQASVRNLSTVDGDTVTLYAQWVPADAAQLSAVGDDHVALGTTAGWFEPGTTVALTPEFATGYKLGTWNVTPAALRIADDGTFTMPASAVTVQAVSTADGYTVAFDGNGADAGSATAEAFTYDRAQALTADPFTKQGYLFAGWSTTPSGAAEYTDSASVKNLASSDKATVTLYAQWWKPVAATDTAAPLVSYDFDHDSGGTVADASPFHNDGTWKGTANYTTGLGGKGAAAQVRGSAGTVQLPLVGGETDGSGDFSVEFWYGDESFTGDAWIFSNNSGSACSSAFNLYHDTDPNGALEGCFGQTVGGTKEYQTVTTAPVQNAWHHVAGVVDRRANTVTWYVDGVQTAQSAAGDMTAATSLVTGLPFTLGQNGKLSYTYDDTALFDDLSFYGSALSAAQIRADYDATKPASVNLPAQKSPSDTSELAEGFLATDFAAAIARTGGSVSQPLAGLWAGGTPTSFAKISGAPWLNVDAEGVVTGTAPNSAPQHPALITVQATDGKVTGRITVSVPVVAADDAPQVQVATWNLWDAGVNVDDSFGKDVRAIAQNGFAVIGVQDDDGTAAKRLAGELGWYSYEDPAGLGIVSAYPIEPSGVIAATTSTPAVGATVDVAGTAVRVWVAGLDTVSADTRDAETAAIVAELGPDLSGTTPVIVLGDLESAAETEAFTAAGLTDTFGTANPSADGDTTLFDDRSDRVDYVFASRTGLSVIESNTVVAGWPSASDIAHNDWTSDHRAVVTTFTVGRSSTRPVPPTPEVSVVDDVLVYQVGHGPTNADALIADAGASADESDAVLAADLDGVDFTAPGWYTAPIVATGTDGFVSVPFAEVVRVVPVVAISLAHASVSFPAAQTLSRDAVVAGLGATLDVDGAIGVDLSAVRSRVPGSYPVTLSGEDDFGFRTTSTATVLVSDSAAAQFDVTVQPAAHGAGSASPGPASVGDTVTLTGAADPGYGLVGWQAVSPGDLAISDAGTFDMPDGPVAVQGRYAPITYSIHYALGGGSAEGDDPTGYTVESDAIALSAPSRYAYTFAGWTGTGLDAASPAVTIPTGSTGDRGYTATWTPAAPEWSASAVYPTAGTTVFYRGALYTSLWWTQGETPGGSKSGAWEEVGAPTSTAGGRAPAWTASWAYAGGETVAYAGALYVAAWYTRGDVPGDPNGPWEQLGASVATGRGPVSEWTASWIYRGGETVAYDGRQFLARYYTRGAVPGGASGAWQDLGVY